MQESVQTQTEAQVEGLELKESTAQEWQYVDARNFIFTFVEKVMTLEDKKRLKLKLQTILP